MQDLTVSDMETLEDALDSLSQKRKKFLVEKEELEDLKEEMADYQEVCIFKVYVQDFVLHGIF